MASSKFDMRGLEKLIEELREDFLTTADLLDTHYNNVNIAKVTGGVGGFVGGGLAVGGAIAAPFTFGVSLVLSIVGASIGVAGGITTGGALVARHFISKGHMKRVQAKWEELQKQCEELKNMPQPASETNGTQMERAAIAVRTLSNAADAVLDTATAALRAAAPQVAVTTPRIVGQIMTTPLFLLSVFSMGLSVVDIVTGSVEIHKQTGSPAGTVCRKLVEQLDKLSQILRGEDVDFQ